MYQPYTYHIYHPITNLHYYGVRFAKRCSPADLWTTYFTSSAPVHKLIDEYGKDSFVVEVRKVFPTARQACDWEIKVLTRLKVLKKPNWLNQNICGHAFRKTPGRPSWNKGLQHTKDHKNKLKSNHKGMLNKQHDSQTKSKMSLTKISKFLNRGPAMWYTNGIIDRMLFESDDKTGFTPGRAKYPTKRKSRIH